MIIATYNNEENWRLQRTTFTQISAAKNYRKQKSTIEKSRYILSRAFDFSLHCNDYVPLTV